MNGHGAANIFVRDQTERLRLLKEMWDDPRVQCYSDSELPSPEELTEGAVFLLGPTSRKFLMEYNWRCQAHHFLRQMGYKGWIYAPEPRGKGQMGDFTEKDYIHSWESNRILAPTTTRRVFWIPRETPELLGLNTNLELGLLLGMAKARDIPYTSIRIGWPETAERMGLPNHYAAVLGGFHIYRTLEGLCNNVVKY